MTDDAAPPRGARQRREDTLRLLADEVDCWVATAGPGGSPWMVPLSFLWHDGELVLATSASSPTARNWAGGAPVRIGLGQVRDVVLVEGTVRLVPAEDVDPAVGDAFAAKAGFDPRVLRSPYVYAFVRPSTLQAWREEDELAGRDLVRDGRWLVRAAPVRVEATEPDDPRAVAAVTAYLAEIDAAFGAGTRLTAAELDPFRAPSGAFVLALDTDGTVLGCGGLRDLGDGVAEVKRMWVSPDARGRGVGRALLTALETRAREGGHALVRLDTNDALHAALGLYRSSGYVEIERYNDNPHARHWFEKRLTDESGAAERSTPA